MLVNQSLICYILVSFLSICHRYQGQRIPALGPWGSNPNKQQRTEKLLNWLILGCDSGECTGSPPDYRHVEYSGYDGFYNNLAKPSQGGIDTPLLRLMSPAYKDGVYQPTHRETNPIEVSDALMNGTNGRTSRSGNTAFLLFFGQQVVEEILDAQGSACPPEYFNIQIPEGHEYITKHPKVPFMPLLRTRFDVSTGYSPNNPRQQLNEITPYIDGGLVYGAAKGWADLLRINKSGKLAPNGKLAWHTKLGEGFPAENSQRMPLANPPPPTNHSEFVQRQHTANVNRFLKLGNPRGNENPFLLTFGIFWFRWHNVIAGFLKEKYTSWSGERIFNEARKWVIATQQSITVYDWLPKFLKTNLGQYSSIDANGRETGGYDFSVDPQISQVFQSAAMRFGHTLVPSGVYLRMPAKEGCGTTPLNLDPHGAGSGHDSMGVRTCNSFWRSPELFGETKNFEKFVMGMSSQSTEAEDNIIVQDLRGRVFGPLEFSRRDLMAINIQRARDHGLPDYNTARKHFGLPELISLSPSEIRQKTKTSVSDEVLEQLQNIYNDDPSKVDIWPGGLLETTNGPGQLFTEVIRNQFERIRAGDRFWFENKKNRLFTTSEIQRIRDLKIIHLVLSVADITLEDIQEDPFTAPRQNNMPRSPACQAQLTTQSKCRVYNPRLQTWSNQTTCRFLPPLSDENLEPCSPPQTYDYFTGSIISYIVTFVMIGVVILALSFGVNTWVVVKSSKNRTNLLSTIKVKEGQFKCKEKVGVLEKRVVIVSFDTANTQILVKNNVGKNLRVMELSHLKSITVFYTETYDHLMIRAENHYDLCLVLNDNFYSQQLLTKLKEFCQGVSITVNEFLTTRTEINRQRITFKDREQQLKQLMESIIEYSSGKGRKVNSSKREKAKASKIQLTKTELANALGMTPENNFFKQFFYLMDKDGNGFVTFQEFLSVMMMFSSGTEEEKAYLFFNIYDLDHSGYLTTEDFKMFIESTNTSDTKGQNTSQIVASLLELVGLKEGEIMTFQHFQEIFKSKQIFGNFGPVIRGKDSVGRRESQFSLYGDLPESSANEKKSEPHNLERSKEDENVAYEDEENGQQTWFQEYFYVLCNYVKSNEKNIFWGFLYTTVMILVFAERAYYYSVEREHAGLRRIAGYGVTVTRGAASAMMFTYSSLLVTMCRNIFAVLRSTIAHEYFPFDEMVQFHKYIGWWALFWTVVHIIGHSINFYHISTQTASDLLCIFRNFFRSTHVLPKFHYWCWETITGFTGVLLTIQVAVIYIFAIHARRHLYKLFWATHNTYPLFYFLTILHGSGQLVQPPFFHYFFLGPAILFTLDKIISVSRKSIKIHVIGAKHLPSNVILLRIQRPNNFSYHSGQWIRIASAGINNQEFHPFTISSAPHEKDLTLHIRVVGPWTSSLRKVYPDFENVKIDSNFKYPEVYIDGPFGEGHQMWWENEVSVFVGGGIGVTPFASILKDFAFKCKQPITFFKCKKVIFLWVTRSQKQFEWMTDILRQAEEADTKNIIKIHIFITQFKSKYDFRTTMLYHAERNFQKVSGRSMFTGLRGLTHFSRPNFIKVFEAIKKQYSQVPIIGVFTCGSLALSSSVDAGCREVNKRSDPVLKHYYMNF